MHDYLLHQTCLNALLISSDTDTVFCAEDAEKVKLRHIDAPPPQEITKSLALIH